MPDAAGASNHELGAVQADSPTIVPEPRRVASGLRVVHDGSSPEVDPDLGTATGTSEELEVVVGESAVDLDLVIPVYNEENRIGPTLIDLVDRLADSPFSARFILVDNGSVDATAEVVDRVSRRGGSIEFINCSQRGKGAAVRAGVAAATAPFTGYVDADQSTPPEALVTALGILSSGWDVVIGSRRAFGAEYLVPQPLLRRMGSRAFNMAAVPLAGRLSDTQCGMKLFRTEGAKKIFADAGVTGFAFDVEILARARRAGLRAMELPVAWSDSEGSSFSPVRDGWRAFADLRRAHQNLRRESN